MFSSFSQIFEVVFHFLFSLVILGLLTKKQHSGLPATALNVMTPPWWWWCGGGLFLPIIIMVVFGCWLGCGNLVLYKIIDQNILFGSDGVNPLWYLELVKKFVVGGRWWWWCTDGDLFLDEQHTLNKSDYSHHVSSSLTS